MIYLDVVLNVPVNRSFTYSYTPDEKKKAEIGKRVEIEVLRVRAFDLPGALVEALRIRIHEGNRIAAGALRAWIHEGGCVAVGGRGKSGCCFGHAYSSLKHMNTYSNELC